MENAIPQDVVERYSHWKKLFTRASNGYLWLGVLSVALSSTAAVVGGLPGQVFAGGAAVLTATLGFLKPERAYLKYVRAWRILDAAIMKYKAGLIDRRALIDAVAAGEAAVSRMEEEESGYTSEPARNSAQARDKLDVHSSDRAAKT